jgi:hypothetical protein
MRIQMRSGSITATLPSASASARAGRLLRRSAACSSGRLWVPAATKQDHRGSRGPPGCEQRPEVRVGGHDDPFFVGRPIKDHLVGGRLEPVLADMDRVVASTAQLLGNARRQRVVHEEPQPAAVSGSSRSRTASAAYLSASVTSSGSRSG